MPGAITHTATAENPYKMWGYIQNPDGTPARYPRIRVLNPDGTSYGDLYNGDSGGVFSFYIPNSDMVVEVYTNDNKTWKGPAYMISHGTTKMVAGSGTTTQVPDGAPSNPAGAKVNKWVWIGLATAGVGFVAVKKKWIKMPKFFKGRRR